eukprot:TRINITY_DN121762_c0_g1_i1.p1 TRINITY_DN121762_c0_g1~~TRINITY_DN121762_c0_g1_i1.p1  ORF type:complete len:954 (-),score=355.57 TRINITY_DN121762_c0_g1_i1:294-3155(-)
MAKPAVIGIDLGASDSYVAFVGKGIVDIVQNEVSKRATPSLVGFLDKERLLGDSALSMIRSNAKNTCRNFKHLLGRDVDAKDVAIENFWSTCKLAKAEDGLAGYDVTYKGQERVFSATEVTAMYLTKLKEITEQWCVAKVADCVIAVPSSFSDVQRQALLDACKIAGLSVLRVMNEHTATALAYGIYRSNDFDAEKPLTVAFASMGHSIFSVSIVQFVKGKLHVVCEKSDKVGGRDMDECLMREFGAQFKKKVGADPLSNKKASFKLEDAVMKTKKILSANSISNVNVECLMEDEDFASQINRDDFEAMCKPMMERVQKVLDDCKAASGLSIEQIDSVEVVGGSSRVPWVKKMISEAFGGKTLSTTMNQEESVARGCALQAAILSPLYKVRDFKVEDGSPYPVNVGWTGVATEETAEAAAVDENGDVLMGGKEGEVKTATVFGPNSAMNTVKTMTFFRKAPFHIQAEYAEPSMLPLGTPKELGSWHIDLPKQLEAKKVKVRAKLTLHGTFTIDGAQLVEEEEYEETLKEKRELPPLEAEAGEGGSADSTEAPAANGVAHSPEGDEKASPAAEAASPSPEGDVEMADKKDEEKKEEKEEEKKEEKAEDKKEEAASGAEERDGTTKPDAEGEKAEAEKAEEKPAEEKKAPEAKNGKKRKAPEKRFEWVDVVKKKRRTKRTELLVIASGRPGLDAETMQKRMDEETAMQVEMREIIETQEKKNELESYVLTMRNKIQKGAELGDFISDKDRDSYLADLTKAEDWVYDAFDATKLQFIEKLDELKVVGSLVQWRCTESTNRKDWIAAVEGTCRNYSAVASNPSPKYAHIPPEKMHEIFKACGELSRWLCEMKAKQDDLPKHEKPVLLCAEMEGKNKELAALCDEILRTPKPKPEKKTFTEAPNDEAAENGEQGQDVDMPGADEADPDATGEDNAAEDPVDVGKGDSVPIGRGHEDVD